MKYKKVTIKITENNTHYAQNISEMLSIADKILYDILLQTVLVLFH